MVPTMIKHTVVSLIAGFVGAFLALPLILPEQSSVPESIQIDTRPTVNVTEREADLISVIDQADDAVVSVIITKDLPIIEQFYEEQSPFGFPFFFNVPQYRQNGTEEREVGGGTAFFISSDGLLLTNKHVIDDKDAEYTILLNDGQRLDAEVVATDPTNDIALLQVEGSGYSYLNLSAEEPVLGQTAIAIGNSLGEFRNTVSVGVISGLQRSVTAGGRIGQPVEQLDQIIQTDTAINQGNSGGPLLSSNGQVLGMNTAVAAGAQNIGFAIPASDLMRAVQSFQEFGEIQSAYLGIRYVPITPTLQQENNLEQEFGVIITKGETPEQLAVIPNSPAAKAGLQEGDILTHLDGTPITLENSFARAIDRKSPGDTVTLRVVRNSQELEVQATLEKQ